MAETTQYDKQERKAVAGLGVPLCILRTVFFSHSVEDEPCA